MEEEKRKLELLVYDLRNSHSEEISLILSVYYDSYKDSNELLKNLKGLNLNSSTYSGKEKRKRSR